jgi:hypothetical protein
MLNYMLVAGEFVVINKEKLLSHKEGINKELGELAVRTEVLNKAAESIAWQEELIETLDRGGAGRSRFPYDTEGAWRLIEVDSEDVVYSPVIAKSELPNDIKSVREVVNDEGLATAQCNICEQSIPLIGRGYIVAHGQGDVIDKYEVAVVHCDAVQLLPPSDKLPFQAHIFPSETEAK